MNLEGGSSLPQKAVPRAGDSCEPSAAHTPSSWGKEPLHLERGVPVAHHSVHHNVAILL